MGLKRKVRKDSSLVGAVAPIVTGSFMGPIVRATGSGVAKNLFANGYISF